MKNTFILIESPLERKLRKYLHEEMNVLFTGRHGTGKSSLVKALWDDEGIKYRMFSAATMDPWVDFVGVPKEKFDEKTGETYLDLVRPREFQDNTIEAIFIDEMSRSHKKVRNAVLELTQFKSINDRKFKNLKVVWAAINPDDDEELEFDVEKLDPAQKDRFQIQITMPYEPSSQYFTKKYGKDIADAAIEWWNALKIKKGGEKTNELINLVSPRRLDYAIDGYLKNCDLGDILPASVNPQALREKLRQNPIIQKLEQLMNGKDIEGSKEFLSDENNYNYSIQGIVTDAKMMNFFIPILDSEKINSLISGETSVRTWALQNFDNYEIIKKALQEILDANTNPSLCRQIEKRFGKQEEENKNATLPTTLVKNPNHILHHVCNIRKNFNETVGSILKEDFAGTAVRFKACKKLSERMPREMDLETASMTLTIFDNIIDKSNLTTFSRWENTMGMINNCVDNLQSNGYDFANFNNDYPSILRYVNNKDDFIFDLKNE